MKKSQKFYLVIKRGIDIFGSFIGILLCAALIYWWVIIINLFATKGHPFFLQERVGKHKKVFKIIKFRSMRVDANPYAAPSDISQNTQQNMETKFGKFLRVTSLDETAQLFNIFVGQMSFIGPRPGAAHNEEELIQLRESYTPNAFDVRPGLGGHAQLIMKRDHNPAEKARLDSEYVQKISFGLDAKIFILTILRIFGVGKGR